MSINISIKRKFKINGKEYNSLEEMPENIREAFKKATDLQLGSGHRLHSAVTRSKITFNGTDYESLEAMPQDVRQLYEKVLRAAQSGLASSGVDIAGISGVLLRNPDVPGTVRAGEIRKATRFESSFSLRTLIAGAFLMALIFLFYYLFQIR